jgi:hypothetical protein
MDIRQEEKRRVVVRARDIGLKVFKDVQLREVGLRFIQIFVILPSPAERLPLRPLDTARINATRLEYFFISRGEVVADHGNHAHLGEIAGSEGKVCGSSTEHILDAAGWARNGVEGN